VQLQHVLEWKGDVGTNNGGEGDGEDGVPGHMSPPDLPFAVLGRGERLRERAPRRLRT
jgi:hypothetical protein